MRKLPKGKIEILWPWFLVFISLLVGGCASTNRGENPKTTAPTLIGRRIAVRSDETLVVGDVVVVHFSGTVDQIPPHEERIKEDGTITLPLIGAIQATGKTPEDLQDEIRNRYVPDSFKRISLSVGAGETSYFVGGQVRQPGRQICSGSTTVTQAIESAGGFTDFALQSSVQLTRADGEKLTVNYVKASKSPTADLPVYPGDRIIVPANFRDCDY